MSPDSRSCSCGISRRRTSSLRRRRPRSSKECKQKRRPPLARATSMCATAAESTLLRSIPQGVRVQQSTLRSLATQPWGATVLASTCQSATTNACTAIDALAWVRWVWRFGRRHCGVCVENSERTSRALNQRPEFRTSRALTCTRTRYNPDSVVNCHGHRRRETTHATQTCGRGDRMSRLKPTAPTAGAQLTSCATPSFLLLSSTLASSTTQTVLPTSPPCPGPSAAPNEGRRHGWEHVRQA
jgi:hypothetical protein